MKKKKGHKVVLVKSSDKIDFIYKKLYEEYGPQGWWPLIEYKGNNPTKTGSVNGYHPKKYEIPRNEKEKFEICLGAILTQNTSWPNVEKALINLNERKLLNPKKILECDEEIIKKCIKPAGYYNQKYKKIINFCDFFIQLKSREPKRNELLGLWGVGEETADSILLYAYKKPVWVIDAYTKRVFERTGIKETKEMKYEELNEIHALIVEHCKRVCLKNKPKCNECKIKDICLIDF
jgi:endonuclease III related protein